MAQELRLVKFFHKIRANICNLLLISSHCQDNTCQQFPIAHRFDSELENNYGSSRLT